jgi:hypothetical protein
MAETTRIDGSCSIVDDKSIALFEALKVMYQRGYSYVIFETDSKSVVDAIHHLLVTLLIFYLVIKTLWLSL